MRSRHAFTIRSRRTGRSNCLESGIGPRFSAGEGGHPLPTHHFLESVHNLSGKGPARSLQDSLAKRDSEESESSSSSFRVRRRNASINVDRIESPSKLDLWLNTWMMSSTHISDHLSDLRGYSSLNRPGDRRFVLVLDRRAGLMARLDGKWLDNQKRGARLPDIRRDRYLGMPSYRECFSKREDSAMTRNCPLACADRLEGAAANPTNRFLQQTYDTVHINLINHSGEFHAARSSKHSSLSRSRGASFDGSIMSACSRVHSTYMCKHPRIITLMTIIIKCITRRAVRTKASLILTAFTLHVSNVSRSLDSFTRCSHAHRTFNSRRFNATRHHWNAIQRISRASRALKARMCE